MSQIACCAVLVAVTVGSAILVPWAFWDGPPPAPPAEPELPDRVFAAPHRDHLLPSFPNHGWQGGMEF